MSQQELKDLLHKLSWEGKYWGKDGAIAVSKKLYKLNEALGGHHALSGLSSTYYSAAGNAAAKARQSGLIEKVIWFITAYLALRTAGRLSDELARKVGMKNLSHDELDIRSAILRKLRRYDESLRCSQEALSREGISSHSRVLLEIGMGEVLDALNRKDEAYAAYNRAFLLTPEIPPTTSVRFYRSYAQHNKRWGNTELTKANFEKALQIAETNNLGDQVEKIKAAMV